MTFGTEWRHGSTKVSDATACCLRSGADVAHGPLFYSPLFTYSADTVNPDVKGLELKPATQIRPYQEKSLAKMFGNGAS